MTISRLSPGSPDLPIAARAADGSVEVELRVPAAPAAVWAALTEAASLACWFGDLTAPLRPGSGSRIEFGDGDFFEVDDVRLDPPDRISYAWRFLGIGPLDRISWQIVPEAAGCRVVVVDRQPGRSPAGVERMQTGWLDFLGRLEAFLTTGQPARYDWSREIEASVELDVDPATAWDRLFRPWTLPGWLGALDPSGSVGERAGSLRANGSADAASAGAWEARQLGFSLREPGWLAATECRITVQPRLGATLLAVLHAGWEGTSEKPAEALERRRRYCARWVQALGAVCELVGGGRRRPRAEGDTLMS